MFQIFYLAIICFKQCVLNKCHIFIYINLGIDMFYYLQINLLISSFCFLILYWTEQRKGALTVAFLCMFIPIFCFSLILLP